MFDIFQHDFITRGFVAGVIIAIVAPVIGIFLVLKRYSLIADTLSHVSLAGIVLGLIFGINPLFTAVGATALSSILIEKLRISKKIYGESALALFLSGSLAVAVILISISRGFNSTLFSYLFGSIATVTQKDIILVSFLSLFVITSIAIIFRKLLFVTFDEDAAKVDRINVNFINTVFIILSAITISIAIPIIGVLLISALLIIPVLSALQFRKTFIPTIIIAQTVSVFSIISGLFLSFHFNLAPGGVIVLVNLIIFMIVSLLRD